MLNCVNPKRNTLTARCREGLGTSGLAKTLLPLRVGRGDLKVNELCSNAA